MRCDTCRSDAAYMVGESNERLACDKCGVVDPLGYKRPPNARAERVAEVLAAAAQDIAAAWDEGHDLACQLRPDLCERVHPNPHRSHS